MIVKQLLDEDFVNYKKPSMFVGFPSCNWKCEKECGEHCCQNSALAQASSICVSINLLLDRYLSNPITQAIVCGGLEPMDSWDDLQSLILSLRARCRDEVVIYTGYNEEEIQDKIEWLKAYGPIIIKFGRYIPRQQSHYDDVLGVNLASSNQYAKILQ